MIARRVETYETAAILRETDLYFRRPAHIAPGVRRDLVGVPAATIRGRPTPGWKFPPSEPSRAFSEKGGPINEIIS